MELEPFQEIVVHQGLVGIGVSGGAMRMDVTSLFRFSLALVMIVLMLATTQGLRAAQDVSMAWDVDNNPAIGGYRVYYRAPHETSASVIDVGKQDNVTLEDLPPETKYFCHVTAYAASGLESGPSNEISFITRPVGTTIKAVGGEIRLSMTGKPGRAIDIYGSSNLRDWTLVASEANRTGELTVPVPRNGAQRYFYRMESRGESFDAWLADRDLTDPSAQFATSGLTNLQAFNSGADLFPSARDAIPALRLVDRDIDGQSSKYATFTYTYRADAADIDPAVESSTDLLAWQPATSSMVVESSIFNGNGTRTVTLRETVPLGAESEPRRLYRVRYRQVSPFRSDEKPDADGSETPRPPAKSSSDSLPPERSGEKPDGDGTETPRPPGK